MSYHNTVPESDELAQQYELTAQKQEALILEMYAAGEPLSPAQVYYKMLKLGYNPPITSPRRSITNLTNAGKLEKTGLRRKGIYGRSENIWKIKS